MIFSKLQKCSRVLFMGQVYAYGKVVGTKSTNPAGQFFGYR